MLNPPNNTVLSLEKPKNLGNNRWNRGLLFTTDTTNRFHKGFVHFGRIRTFFNKFLQPFFWVFWHLVWVWKRPESVRLPVFRLSWFQSQCASRLLFQRIVFLLFKASHNNSSKPLLWAFKASPASKFMLSRAFAALHCLKLEATATDPKCTYQVLSQLLPSAHYGADRQKCSS